jgi:L-iditol 2-dehydrogenase
MDSRVAVVTAFERPLEIWTVPVPALEPGSALVRVEAATLCGTDAHRWQNHTPVELPFVPGHETCGSIVEHNGPIFDILGTPLHVGDRIITSYGSCGHCYWCKVTGQTTLCPEVRFFGAWHPAKLLGGCSELHYFPPRASFIRVPDNVPSPLAASAACALRTVMHAFEHVGRIDPHETVLIQGAGPLGLYASAVARDRGAKRVLLIGAPAVRLAVAFDFGADEVLNMDEVADTAARLAWVQERTNGRGADVVVNCASSPAFAEALGLARRGGRVVTVGVAGKADVTYGSPLLWRGLRIDFVVMAEARHFMQAIDFLSSAHERFPFERLLSGQFDLNGTTEAMHGMAGFREIKPVIYPNGIPALAAASVTEASPAQR